MIIEINFDSQTPLFTQLRDQIVIGIAQGKLKPGDALPSVRQMAEDLGINLHTVNKSYRQLREEGYITMSNRTGAVIRTNELPTALFDLERDEPIRVLCAEAMTHGYSPQDFADHILDVMLTIQNVPGVEQ